MLLVVVTILSYFRELMLLGENKYMKFCELD